MKKKIDQIRERLDACLAQCIETPAPISNYEDLKQRVIYHEAREECRMLNEALEHSPDAFIRCVLERCMRREMENADTCLSYAHLPDSPAHQLYSQLIQILFAPESQAALLEILLPGQINLVNADGIRHLPAGLLRPFLPGLSIGDEQDVLAWLQACPPCLYSALFHQAYFEEEMPLPIFLENLVKITADFCPYQRQALDLAVFENAPRLGGRPGVLLYVIWADLALLGQVLEQYHAEDLVDALCSDLDGMVVLHAAAPCPEALSMILGKLQPAQYQRLLAVKDDLFEQTIVHLVAQYPLSFEAFLSFFPKTDWPLLLSQRDKFGHTPLHYSHDNLGLTKTILEILHPAQRREQLLFIPEWLHGVNLLEFAVGTDYFFHFINLLPPADKIIAITHRGTTKNNIFAHVCKDGAALRMAWELFPADWRLEALLHAGGLEPFLPYPAALRVLFKLVMDTDDRKTLLDSSWIGKTLQYPESLQAIVANYPAPVIKHKLKHTYSRKEGGTALLVQAKKKPEIMNIIAPLFSRNNLPREGLFHAIPHPLSLEDPTPPGYIPIFSCSIF